MNKSTHFLQAIFFLNKTQGKYITSRSVRWINDPSSIYWMALSNKYSSLMFGYRLNEFFRISRIRLIDKSNSCKEIKFILQMRNILLKLFISKCLSILITAIFVQFKINYWFVLLMSRSKLTIFELYYLFQLGICTNWMYFQKIGPFLLE